MKNHVITGIALLAFAVVGTSAAQAGNGYRFGNQGYGGQNYGYGQNYGNVGRGYNQGFQNYGRGNYGVQRFGNQWRQGGHYVPHTTTHYDYHAPSLQPHGNHLDYVPGHYDPHTTTHFDYHRGH